MLRPAALVGLLFLAACSKKTPASDPAPPIAKEAPPAGSAMTMSAAIAPPAEEPPAPPPPSPRSLAGKKVLHVGDSMVGGNFGLTRALEGKLEREGATIVRHTKVSETITSFDKASTLRDLLRTHDPDIVVVTLGANDALVPHPEVFAKSVQNIARRLDGRECWWMGPPMWTKDTGVVAVIRENVGDRCRFFDGSELALERTADGIHPNDRGAARWADAFWEEFATALPRGDVSDRGR